MMAAANDKAEHRGWEIKSDYHPHFLDDADFVIDGEEERGNGFLAVLVLGVVLSVGVYLLGIWLQPPPVVFPAPLPPFASSPAIGSCISTSTAGIAASNGNWCATTTSTFGTSVTTR